MDRRDFSTEADYLRHHRRCFELGLELGVTPREAEKKLAQMQARERDRAASDRLQTKINTPLQPVPDFQQWNAPWMART